MIERPDVRFWTVTDDATAMRVMVVVPAMVRDEEARRVLRGAGYNVLPPASIAIVTRLSNLETHHDPFSWREWTTRAFHLLLLEEFDRVWEIPDGGEINVREKRLALAEIYGR